MNDLFEQMDLLFKNVFETDSFFKPVSELKRSPYPVDIYEHTVNNKKRLFIEVACTGLYKDDIKVETEGNIIRISHAKQEEKTDKKFYINGIAKRSFDLAYTIPQKFDLSKTIVYMDKGLLTIEIPLSDEKQSKVLEIK